ncbi:homoserine kinase [Hahella sp. CCB-MM4]|uniref:homoserine kinase n=1 Tax=Hahella sp. (strain CCB-MM4) TaxID=1926491 RepID=UPI000B9C1165|nr:homoserine kinase [Hahella sp. CCB-MM4]OZG74254.1 homoserine kinase [Hahella sp. CCB-MM4]
MAVFTKVSEEQLQSLLEKYFVGPEVRLFEGISAGIENTNYFVDVQTEAGISRWVLTLFEMVSPEELPIFVSLTQQLAAAGVPVPAALADREGKSIQTVAGKKCILVPRVSGRQLESPSEEQCHRVGQLIAELHLAAENIGEYRAVVRDQGWLENHQRALEAHLESDDAALLKSEIQFQHDQQAEWGDAPKGWIHGDLFVDNILFDHEKVSGIIDFYHACHDYWLMDLAVACNDWCYELGKGYDTERLKAFVSGYDSKRPLTAGEKAQWSSALRLAALRFWISRLISLHGGGYQSQAEQGEVFKNPDEMKEKLLAARAQVFPAITKN